MYKVVVKSLTDDKIILSQSFENEMERKKLYESILDNPDDILDKTPYDALSVICEDSYKGIWVEISVNLITK